jgi:hypothetical protein
MLFRPLYNAPSSGTKSRYSTFIKTCVLQEILTLNTLLNGFLMSGMMLRPHNHIPGTISIPSTMLCESEHALILSIYGSMAQSNSPPPLDYFHDHIILAAQNEDVHLLNTQMLYLVCGNEQSYMSADIHCFEPGAEQHQCNIPVKFLHSLNASGLPLSHLTLKVGCLVILLHNLDSKQGLYNGMCATVIHMSYCILEVWLIGGNHDGKLALIPRITLSPSVQGFDFPINLKRRQFPVQLAFVMTINKSQGQSVSHVSIDLHIAAFSHGQLYVAFSHTTSPSHVSMLLPRDTVENQTANVVFPEVLIN